MMQFPCPKYFLKKNKKKNGSKLVQRSLTNAHADVLKKINN